MSLDEGDGQLRFDGVKVLLVDDEPNLLRVVRRILHRRGAEVTLASNGLDALEALISSRRGGPD